MSATPSPAEALAALLARASPAAQAYAADELTRQRYLTAHNGSAQRALEGLEATAAWRATAIHPSYACALCQAKPGAHCFVSLGQDAQGAAIIYGCPARASEGGEVARTVEHCVNCLERQWGAGGGGGGGGDAAAPQTWVWLVDFNGFGMSHALQARLGISFATTFRDHFPERLKTIVLLNPPVLFRMLVSAIGAVADARTMAKLKVVEAAGAQALCQRLRAEHAVEDAEVLAWLEAVLGEAAPTPGTLPPLPQRLQGLQV
jgi:hypothetical protein